MSIRNANWFCFRCTLFSGLGCSAILTLLKRYNRDKENEDGESL